MKSFKQFITEESDTHVTAWHGSDHEIKSFDTSKLKGGNDQAGPGMYCTTNKEEAASYDKYLYKLKLDTKKFIKPGQKTNEEIARKVTEASPHLASQASNWSEDHDVGVEQLHHSTIDHDEGHHETMERVWADSHNFDNHSFIKAVGEHHYGTSVEKQYGGTYHIVWNGDAIKSIKKVKSD